MLGRRLWIGCILLLIAWSASSQPGGSSLRRKKVPVQEGPILLDFQAIVPGSFSAFGIDSLHYRLDAAYATLFWLRLPVQDSVWVSYRVFPFGFAQTKSRYRFDSIANFFKAQPGRKMPTAVTPASRLLDWQGLTYTGSFGRSLSVGNTQDAVVNSLFNLQISGMLADSIMLTAAITDNNIPIQPDGTTQQLNEFDRVWLQFRKRQWALSIGDVDVRQQPTYFLSFFKRQQGIAFETTNRIGKGITAKTFVSGAVAKGKFTRNILTGVEGNQGPYRLQGANGELFFVVLAGTERVFIDGVQMQRGEDQDYVINYNTAEVTFTPKQLINKDKRIQIEFEYADRNYLNSLLYAGTQWQVGNKLQLVLAMYSNADAKNSPINQTLTSGQKQLMSEVGDSIQLAFTDNAVADSFSAGKVLYVKLDTLVNGNVFSIYRYQAYNSGNLYNVSFTEVGQNRGNYIPLLNGANGMVYQWVIPINGVPQGNYEPVARLVTPKKQQMVTAGLRYQVSAYSQVQAEAAWSVSDINTFSSKDKANDKGTGIKLLWQDDRPLQRGRFLQSAAGYEQVDSNFRPLERLRTVEFLRDWGLPFDAGFAQERLPSASISLRDSLGHQAQYAYMGYWRNRNFSGQRHQVTHQWHRNAWQVNNFFQYTSLGGTAYKGFFLRPRIDVRRQWKQWGGLEAYAGYALEHNELKNADRDTLLNTAFSFTDWKAGILGTARQRNRWSMQWMQRRNQFASSGGFVPLDVNNNWNLRYDWLSNRQHQVRLNAGYRTLKVVTSGLTNQQSDQTFVGRLEYLTQIAKGAISGNVLYEAGAGQEQQRNFSFVEVPAGRGEYVWNDYNNDGLQQLNEFEVAQFADQAKYIRLFTPTNQFVKAAYNTLNVSVALSPANIWRRDSTRWKRQLSKWQAQTALQTSGKRISDGGYYFNPFASGINDTALIYYNFNWVNTLSFNRYSTRWGADLTQVRNTAKALLTYGTEARYLNDYSLRLRYNIGRTWVLQASGKAGENKLITPNPKFDNRNYSIRYYQLQPSAVFIRGTSFRSQLSYAFSQKQGDASGVPQRSRTQSLQNETKYNLLQKGVFTGKFTYSYISFSGTANSTVGFIMLDALQPGQNYLWSFDFTRRLANALELTMQYEGRKPGDTKVVHIGRAGIRAIL